MLHPLNKCTGINNAKFVSVWYEIDNTLEQISQIKCSK